MGFLSRAVAETKGYSTLDLFTEIYGSKATITGRSVSVKTALEVSTVFACCRVIGEGIAQVPLKLLRESKDGRTKLPAKDHPLYQILAVRPNSQQTSFEFREMMAWHLVLTGNFFAFKNTVFGTLTELIPFEPGHVRVTREDNGVLTYEVTAQSGSIQVFPAEAIWHVRGPSWVGWMGLDSVHLAREAIGLAMATEEQHARMHKNGVRASGVYSVDGALNPEQYKALKAWIDKEMGGLENTGKPMLLDRGAKWLNTSMTGVDSQHLETRKHQIGEICRFFRVNPIMVYGDDKLATYAGSSENFLSHVVHTLSPWWTRLEASIDTNLLTEKERKQGYFSQFVEEGMLRGSALTTKDVILGYVNGGVMTTNEGRALLDLNPDEDPVSDKLRIPANIVGTLPDGNPPAPAPADTTKADAALAGLVEVKSLLTTIISNPQRPQDVHVKAGDVHVNMPDVKHTVSFPEQPAPVVNNTINMPEQPAPQVHVTQGDVKVDVQPTPIEVKVAAPNVTMPDSMNMRVTSMPKRKTESTVERDSLGNIVNTSQIEKDSP